MNRHSKFDFGSCGGCRVGQVTKNAVQFQPGFRDVNTLLGNFKSAITGTCRWVSPKHAGRYLAAYEYRFNRRFDLAAMLDRLERAAIQAAPKPHAVLIADTVG